MIRIFTHHTDFNLTLPMKHAAVSNLPPQSVIAEKMLDTQPVQDCVYLVCESEDYNIYILKFNYLPCGWLIKQNCP